MDDKSNAALTRPSFCDELQKRVLPAYLGRVPVRRLTSADDDAPHFRDNLGNDLV